MVAVPGDTVRASLDFAAGDASSAEGYNLSYVKNNKVLTAVTLPAGEEWVDEY
ncbi:hypothetical protein [Paenibacillus endoradicis]|uniref:hypothetical protein n=1 Tax=Paenibacillus endoradicis TaxID=2972487 RepID=UPI002159AED2|nr:hypothetical protein [Paenibacillus endoradicis]MCR8656911.1 hypothetical protein [Paenibacillus endoradicis]